MGKTELVSNILVKSSINSN